MEIDYAQALAVAANIMIRLHFEYPIEEKRLMTAEIRKINRHLKMGEIAKYFQEVGGDIGYFEEQSLDFLIDEFMRKNPGSDLELKSPSKQTLELLDFCMVEIIDRAGVSVENECLEIRKLIAKIAASGREIGSM